MDGEDETVYGSPATRLRILEAARTLIEDEGLQITMARVAEAAGVSRQALYKHVGSRSGLLVQLVGHLDDVLGLADLVAPVREAATGREALEAMVAVHAVYHQRIIGFTRQAEALRHTDDAVAAAWEDRMAGRRVAHREIVERLADEGELADGWDVDSGALLFYTVTLPRLWDELVVEQGWTIEKYREHVTRLLVRGFLADP